MKPKSTASGFVFID